MYTEKDINELEQFFKTVSLPKELQLTPDQKITDVKKFYENHLAAVRANIGKNTFNSFYDRLVKMKELLQKQ
jgi:hypothetical protein